MRRLLERRRVAALHLHRTGHFSEPSSPRSRHDAPEHSPSAPHVHDAAHELQGNERRPSRTTASQHWAARTGRHQPRLEPKWLRKSGKSCMVPPRHPFGIKTKVTWESRHPMTGHPLGNTQAQTHLLSHQYTDPPIRPLGAAKGDRNTRGRRMHLRASPPPLIQTGAPTQSRSDATRRRSACAAQRRNQTLAGGPRARVRADVPQRWPTGTAGAQNLASNPLGPRA